MRVTHSIGLPVETGAGPPEARPIVTYLLIAVNTLVYFITAGANMLIATDNYWVRVAGFSPILVLSDPLSQSYRLLTSMFIHGDILHIFFNMYFLYMFGRAVENTLGSARFLTLYLASGLVAALFHTVFSFAQGIDALSIPAVGASGAISGVLGAYMMLYPGTRLTACFWFFLLPFCYTTPAVYFLLFWFALQVFYGYMSMGGAIATIAFFAHAGGFLAGIAFLPLVAEKSRIAVLRAFSLARPTTLFEIIVLPRWGLGYREGLGRGAKTAFALLTIALLAGAGAIAGLSITSSLIAAVSYVDASVEGMGTSSGSVVFHLSRGEAAIVTTSLLLTPDEVRILINRLYNSGIFFNPQLAGQTIRIVDRTFIAAIEACGRRVPVPVLVKTLEGKYDETGILSWAQGSIESRVVHIVRSWIYCRFEVSEPVEIRFNLSTRGPFDIAGAMLWPSLLTIIVTLLALHTITSRDRELVITPV